jgi:hypothetical protein
VAAQAGEATTEGLIEALVELAKSDQGEMPIG